MERLRSMGANLLVAFASLVALMLVLEFVVFRFVLVAAEMPAPVFSNQIVKYKAHQAGVYRVKDAIEARFRINANGWNSGHDVYGANRDTPLVAIIGDSYVSALQVDYDESVAEQLETDLGRDECAVYRFGIDGAPLSQYLHMLRREVLPQRPTVVVVILVHNDFYESYGFKPGVYTSAFMKLKMDNDEVVGEIEPTPFEPPPYNWIRASATWRYLAYRQQIRFGILRDMILGRGNPTRKKYQANVETSALDDRLAKDRAATDYVFRELKRSCEENEAGLLVVMDGDRNSIQQGLDTDALYETGALRLNALAATVARAQGIAFLDLHPVFERQFAADHERLSFENDGHWNAYAHKIAAEEIGRYIREHFWAEFRRVQ